MLKIQDGFQSALAPQAENNYDVRDAHDFSLKTAWVEGTKGQGIGEYIEHYFEPNSPRVNQIEIMNGYDKSEASWRNKSRVKRFNYGGLPGR